MGTNSAPDIANLLLHALEYNYVLKCYKEKDHGTCKDLRFTFRFIDDITNFNGNGTLERVFPDIYGDTLDLVKVNNSNKAADVLDIYIHIENGVFITKTFDKRRDFDSEIFNFPHFNSNVPITMCLSVFKQQVRM